MKREHRYFVAKIKDVVKHLTDEEQTQFVELLKKIDTGRQKEGKQNLECVCVENDWPEYHEVWSMISSRVDGIPLTRARMQQHSDYED